MCHINLELIFKKSLYQALVQIYNMFELYGKILQPTCKDIRDYDNIEVDFEIKFLLFINYIYILNVYFHHIQFLNGNNHSESTYFT